MPGEYTTDMARLNPDLATWHPKGAGEYAERAVLEQLRDGLPDGFDVFHSVDWSTVESGAQRFGEIDVVVVDPQGHLALLEIKSGHLNEASNMRNGDSHTQLLKRYTGKDKDVIGQSNGQLKAMRQALQREGFEGFKVAHLLVLPDHIIKSATLSIPRERIVDAKEISELCQRVLQLVNQGQADRADADGARARLLLFLSNRFRLVPDPTARIGVLNNAVTRLSNGLANWVPRIRGDAGIYVIEATAGSGKTQLALRLLRDACAKGLRCMYVCYNRPLADHIVRVAPAAAQVNNFHELAVEHYRRKHGSIDFCAPGIFDVASDELVADSLLQNASELAWSPPSAYLDLLIIDEMQDMQPQWVDAMVSRLRSEGRMYLMGDSQQSIYPRETFDLAGAVHINCDENYRSPRRIVETINLLGLTEDKIEACCPELGEVPDIRAFAASDVGGLREVERTVSELLSQGVDPTHIAIVTFAGRDRSAVLSADTIGGQPIRKFTGRFDVAGNPVWTDGTILTETLYRFKGQAAPYVVLCEVDFNVFDEKQRRKLFVGMTRAQMGLMVLVSMAAEQAMREYLNAE